MTKLIWDEVSKRVYETGVDRGVLYLPNGKGVPWNGLLSVEDVVQNADIAPYYLDGQLYFNDRTVGDYSGVLRAFTYPDEFLQFDGMGQPTIGLFAANQPVMDTFDLSYRTMVGNDTEGLAYGYKIHILYNLVAVPSTKSYVSQSSSPNPLEFSWEIAGVPVEVPGFRPTCHFILDTRHIPEAIVAEIEDVLYGSASVSPSLPNANDLMGLIFNVIDNGDGTWTAKGSNEVIQYLNPTTFQIEWPGAVYITPDTYTLSNTVEET